MGMKSIRIDLDYANELTLEMLLRDLGDGEKYKWRIFMLME